MRTKFHLHAYMRAILFVLVVVMETVEYTCVPSFTSSLGSEEVNNFLRLFVFDGRHGNS